MSEQRDFTYRVSNSKKNSNRQGRALALAAAAAITGLVSTAQAVDHTWIGTTGAWEDANNWSNGTTSATVPTLSDNAFVNNAGTAVISAAGANADFLYIGNQ